MATYEELGLLPQIAEGFKDRKSAIPSSLEAEVIPLILGGGDVVIRAEPNISKLAFGPPIVQNVYETLKHIKDKNVPQQTYEIPLSRKIKKHPIALIVEVGISAESMKILTLNPRKADPILTSKTTSRQTLKSLQKFARHLQDLQLDFMLGVGGKDKMPICKEQEHTLLTVGADIIVGSPVRLGAMLSRGFLKLANFRYIVINEAYTILKHKYPLFERLYQDMPKLIEFKRRPQLILCSFSLHNLEIQKMMTQLLHFPIKVDLNPEESTPETTHHVMVNVDPQKDSSWKNKTGQKVSSEAHDHDYTPTSEDRDIKALSEAMKMLKQQYCIRAIDALRMEKAVIFCRTKWDCDDLEKYMKKLDSDKYSCLCLHDGRKLFERKANTGFFKKNKVKFLITTHSKDLEKIANRSELAVSGVPYVINMSVPDVKTEYFQRIVYSGSVRRIGLIINLVSTVPEQIWHTARQCKVECRHCKNTEISTRKGYVCFNEQEDFALIEEDLDTTVERIKPDMKVPLYYHEGRVIYGQKATKAKKSDYKSHVLRMAPVADRLSKLESHAQLFYIRNNLTNKMSLTNCVADGKANGYDPASVQNLSDIGPAVVVKVEPPDSPDLESQAFDDFEEVDVWTDDKYSEEIKDLNDNDRGRLDLLLEIGVSFEDALYRIIGAQKDQSSTLHQTSESVSKSPQPDPTDTEAPSPEKAASDDDDDDNDDDDDDEDDDGDKDDNNDEECVPPSILEGDPAKKPFDPERNSLNSSTTEPVAKKPRLDTKESSPGAPDFGIKVGIAHQNYPDTNLSEEQLKILRCAVIKAVEQTPDDGPQVRFQDCVNESGWLRITCNDQESISWLQNIIDNLKPWEGAKFKLVHGDASPKSHVYSAYIEDDFDRRLTPEEVLTRLNKMNRSLDTRKWAVLDRKESGPGQVWTFSIDDPSVGILRGLSNRPYFGFGRVKFRRRTAQKSEAKSGQKN